MDKKKIIFIIGGLLLIAIIIFLMFKLKGDKSENQSYKSNGDNDRTSSVSNISNQNNELNSDTNKSNKNNSEKNESVIKDVKKKYEEDKSAKKVYDKNGDFLFQINDVFTVIEKGTAVVGTILRGSVKAGDEVQIVGLGEEKRNVKVIEIEALNQHLDEKEAGEEELGIILEDIQRDDVDKGQVLAKPNSIEAHKKFDAEIYMLTSEEKGRSEPILNGARLQYFFKNTDITGTTNINGNIEQINPGDNNVKITVELATSVAMETGDYFAIRFGGRVLAHGYVTKIYE